MRTENPTIKLKGLTLPSIIEKGVDGFYVVECPVLEGCFTQGRTIDEAIKNIKEVIELIFPEKNTKEVLREYRPKELSFHTITL